MFQLLLFVAILKMPNWSLRFPIELDGAAI
jgi:hypothetical protein